MGPTSPLTRAPHFRILKRNVALRKAIADFVDRFAGDGGKVGDVMVWVFTTLFRIATAPEWELLLLDCNTNEYTANYIKRV